MKDLIQTVRDTESGGWQVIGIETAVALADEIERLTKDRDQWISNRAGGAGMSDLLPCPTDDEILKAVYESGLHQYASKGILTTKWKDGIDVDSPSLYLIHFVKKLWNTRADTKPQWIPVTERLPVKKVIARYINCAGNERKVMACYVPRWTVESTGEEDYYEHHEESDIFYLREGWYEQLDNWGEYSACYIHEGVVTHFCEIPEGPE